MTGCENLRDGLLLDVEASEESLEKSEDVLEEDLEGEKNGRVS